MTPADIDAALPNGFHDAVWLFVSTWSARMAFTARECALEWT